MPISGLVLKAKTQTAIPDLAAELGRDPRLQLGAPVGPRIPLVSDTADREEDRKLWDWISSRPGVIGIDVVYIHFDDPEGGRG